MKKLLNPKILAITTIVTAILNLILSITLRTTNIPSYFHFNQIISIIISFVLSGNLYITIYLFIILLKKQKNMKLLNIILFINLIVATVFYVISEIIRVKNISSIITISSESIFIFKIFFNLLFNIIFLVLETIMVYGIFAKKNLPYKVFTIILLSLNAIWFLLSVISIVSSGMLLLNLVYLLSSIIVIIQSCSFVLFVYLYGKSISERSKNNE